MLLLNKDQYEDYASIPTNGEEATAFVDEEQGLLSGFEKESQTHITNKQTLAEKYPEANKHERAFLGALDDAIDQCAVPQVTLPKIRNIQDLGTPDTPKEFLESLLYPTLALLTSLAASVVIMIKSNPIFIALFPYFSCAITFLATLPPIQKRFRVQAKIVLKRIDSQKQAVEDKVSLLGHTAVTLLERGESLLEHVLAPIRDKLDQVTELESMLRVVDPDIDIPDVTDIEEAFDGTQDYIRDETEKALDVVGHSVSRVIPEKLRTREGLDWNIFYPIVGILLGIQLFVVWLVQRHLHKSDTSEPGPNVDGADATEETTQLALMIISIQIYLVSMVEIITFFLTSNIAMLAKTINKFVTSIQDDVNETLEKYLGGPFDLVFNKGMRDVRAKTLELIHQINKVEGPLEKARDMREYEAKLQRLKEEAEAKTREAAEKAKAEAERLKAEMEAKAKAEAERLKAEAERLKAEAEAKAREAAEKAKAEAERKKAEVEAKAREAAEKAKAEAERLKAEMEAKSKAEAERLKAEAERLKAEAEDEAREAAEKVKAEAERKKAEVEAKAREATEKAKAEVERLKEGLEAKAKAEAERLKAEAEAKAREASERAKEEAEKVKAEAERKKAEAQAAVEKAKAEAKEKARAAAEKIQKEADQKRAEAEAKVREAAEKAKAEAERLKAEAQEAAERLKLEVEARAKAEAERLKAEAAQKKAEAEKKKQRAKRKVAEAKATMGQLSNNFGKLGGGFGF